MKRLITKAAVVLGAASLLLGQTPSADAATVGLVAGAVVGQVTVNPTVPIGACIPTGYSFGTTAIAGVGAEVQSADNGALLSAGVGLVDVTANGGSPCENTDHAVGNVNINGCGNIVGASADSNGNVSTVGIAACNIGGAYERTGPLVIVHLCGTVHTGLTRIDAIAGANTIGGCIDVVALFVPTNAGIVTGTTVTAAFAGVFENLVDTCVVPDPAFGSACLLHP